jgi:hypothetical protein
MTLFSGDLVTWPKLTLALEMCFLSSRSRALTHVYVTKMHNIDNLKMNNKRQEQLANQ